MINHIWSVVCERTILDRVTNLISIINSLEELTVQGPLEKNRMLAAPIEIISYWVRSDFAVPEKGQANYKFVTPSGETIKNKEIDIDLLEYERLRSRIQFTNLNFPEPGLYQFQVDYRIDNDSVWETVVSIPLKVNVVDEPEKAVEA